MCLLATRAMRATLTISNSSKPSQSSAWQQIERRLKQRREQMADIRNMRLQNIQKDIKRIAKDEVAYANKMIKDGFPLEIKVDDSVMDNMPIRIRWKEEFANLFRVDSVTPDIMDDDELADSLDI